MPFDEQLVWVLNKAKGENLISPDLESSYLLRYFRVFQANWVALRNHIPKGFNGRLTIFRSERGVVENPTFARGWGRLAADVEVLECPGNHMTMLRPPNVQFLAEKFRSCLIAAEAAGELGES